MAKKCTTVKVSENAKQVAHQLLNKSKSPAENRKFQNRKRKLLTHCGEKGNLQRNGILLAPKPRINNFRHSSKMTPNLIIEPITAIQKCI